ncbi:MAG: hypothetical protein ISS31_02950 [Kiritimatiellae bacterium]|nr:hypothetical protein [Kiritimatiellia bacterium]
MATQQVKFGEWLGQGFDLFKENIGPLILVSLVAQLLAGISAGILAGPMMAGLAIVTLNLVDKKGTPDVSTLFEGFNYFLQSFLFVLVWSAIMLVAYLISLATCGILVPVVSVAGLFIGALIMFAPYLIVEKKLAFWPASMKSMEMVKPNVWPLLGYFLVVSMIGSAGSAVCGIGVIVTMPIAWCMYAVAYRELTSGGGAPAEAAPAPAPPAAPVPAPEPEPAPAEAPAAEPEAEVVEEETKAE